MKPIFIFSLPRSGSTLLQRMLAASEHVSTVSEPWLLLPFVYTLKSSGVKAEYEHNVSVRAIHDFCKQLPNGRQDYLNELRDFILKLYKSSAPKSTYFLDKTPRYHLIINEIREIFPDAKFIFLWRNPLAVVASIINTWGKGKWKLRTWHVDLYDGVNNLLSAYTENSYRVHSLQYENLVKSPSTEMKKICDYLEIDYSVQMIESFQSINLEGKWGDNTGVKKYSSVSQNSLNNWKKTFNNPRRRYWAVKYLNWIGEKNLKIMGYEYQELAAQISSEKSMSFSTMFSDLIRSVVQPTINFMTALREKRSKTSAANITNFKYSKPKY